MEHLPIYPHDDDLANTGAFILNEAQRLRMDPQHVAQAVQLLEDIAMCCWFLEGDALEMHSLV